ncbi:MAG: hypothetical protein RL264_1429 [Bacteroidota bacterium]|jgi:hypothetical protein
MRRPYRKYFVIINNRQMTVKDWYRDNLQLFQHINGVPTSEQIGTVLIAQRFNRTDSETEVIYR